MATTVKDIARETGISLTTISKFMNGGNVLEENRVLIEKAIIDLDYKVNRFARGLKTNKSMIIGIVIPGIKSIFSTTIISEAEDRLRKAGYGVIVCDSRGDQKREREILEFLSGLRVDGILIVPIYQCSNHFDLISNIEMPIVVMDAKIKGMNLDNVISDNSGGAYNAVSHLIKHGHKKIGILYGMEEIYTSKERLKGYKDALKDNGIEVNKDYIICTDYNMSGGYEGMKKIITDKLDITALFTANYYLTLGAYMAINENQIKIPEALSIVGFDKFDLSNVIRPELTTISQSVEEIALRAATILLSRLSGEKRTKENTEIVVVPTSLNLGASVKKINK